MKKAILVLAVVLLIVAQYLVNKLAEQRGCEKAIYNSVTSIYGEPPEELQNQIKQSISEDCKKYLQ